MKLSDLLVYNDIVIQCHDNPDADAIASGFGLYVFFKEHGKNVRLVYSGRYTIKKSNLVLMTQLLEIPIEKVDKLSTPELLITVDCQYGEGNVKKHKARNVAVIDHHQVGGILPRLSDVRSSLGACSTLVWNLLENEGMEVNDNINLASALYYGLYTDTNGFVELFHPLDRDLRDEANYNKALIRKLVNANLSLDELKIAGKALLGYDLDEKHHFAIIKVPPCDPNIIGMISDLMLKVDVVDCALVYSEFPFGVKISARSCVKETKASDLMNYIIDGIGSGGGHVGKAGGFVRNDLFDKTDIKDFFKKRLTRYFEEHEVIYADEYELDVDRMRKFKKLPVTVGFVKATDLAPVGTVLNIRTLEDDQVITIEEDLFLAVSAEGKVTVTQEEKFRKTYVTYNNEFVFEGDYPPSVRDEKIGHSTSILKYAKCAVTSDEAIVYARILDHPVKVFNAWDPENYLLGGAGDYLVCRADDAHDIFVVAGDIFKRNYGEL